MTRLITGLSGGIKMICELEKLNHFENNIQWMKKHYSEIQEKHSNNYVAINDDKIITVNKNFNELLKDITQKKLNPSIVLIEFVNEKGVKIIL